MFTLKYKPDQYGPMAVLQFANGWKRVRKSAASYYHTLSVDHGSMNAKHHEIKCDKYYLNSYAAPLAYISIITDCTDEHKNMVVFLNEDVWQYSQTTRRNLSDFLHYIAFMHGTREVNYHLLKRIMNDKRMQFYHDAPLIADGFTSHGFKYSAHVCRCNDNAMLALFADTPKITCEIIY